MTTPDDDLARLQRIAFGSGSSDSERADAARELDLRRAAAAPPPPDPADEPGDGPSTPPTPPPPPEADAAPAGATAPVAPAAAGRRWLQLVVGVGAAALVVGLFAGWQLGSRGQATAEAPASTPPATPYNGPRTLAEYIEALPLALETPAADVFARTLTADDVPDGLSMSDARTGAPEFRLLATTNEGVRIYGSRDKLDLCLTVATPAATGLEATAVGTCTEDGRFPEDGLLVNASTVREVADADGSTNFVLTSFSVTWTADGRLAFGP